MFRATIPKEKRYSRVHGFKRERFPGDGFWYCKNQVKPWCVQYCFAGHYFFTLPEALKYAAKRKFITYDMVDRIRINLEERGIAE